MTMRELAKAANVSVSTVSKAFHGGKDISEETREHIFSVAKELGCYGKFHQGKYNKKVIAVICPELAGQFYSTFTELLQEMIEKAGCICTISTDHFLPEVQAQLIEYYSEYLKVDGILVFDLHTKTYSAVTVTNNYQSCELHNTSALYSLRNTVDSNNLLCKL